MIFTDFANSRAVLLESGAHFEIQIRFNETHIRESENIKKLFAKRFTRLQKFIVSNFSAKQIKTAMNTASNYLTV